jgi:hypothetical protein
VTVESESPADHHDDPAVPGEIAALERFLGHQLAEVGPTPHLGRDTVRELLEQIAFRSRAVAGQVPPAIRWDEMSPLLDWPAGPDDAGKHTVITELLGAGGIFVTDGDALRFADRTVHEYLAAGYIVRRQPHGPRWRDLPPWRYLAPQEIWPWPDAGVTLFVTALWRRNARSRVDRRLRSLLRARHRHPNIRFVIELVRRDLVPGSGLSARTATILDDELADGRQDNRRWQAMSEALRALDPERADAKLESLFRTPPRTITPHRRFTALDELRKHDPARGARNLRFLADNPTGTPEENLENAALIAARDHEEGVRAMRLLANTPAMDELRADAAIHAGSPDLLAELIEHPRGLSDAGRLKVSGELLKREPATAVAVMVKFVETAVEQDTPLRIAELIEPHEPHTSLRIAHELAWPVEHRIDSRVRLRAVRLIGKIDGGQAIPALHRLSADGSVLDEVRLAAAKHIAEDGGPITALIDLAKDPALERPYRVEAASVAGSADPAAGAELYLSIAKTGAPASRGELALLRKAYGLRPGPAAEALAEIAKDTRVQGEVRIEAVEIAGPTLSKRRKTDLYTAIATTADDSTALTAAGKVSVIDLSAGQRLAGTLAGRKNAGDTFRLTAAAQAGSHGVPALVNLAGTARTDSVRLRAARNLYAVDRTKGTQALRKLVNKSKAGWIRVEAALVLPKTLSTDALIAISEDPRENDLVRFGAGVKAMDQNEKRGRQALLVLAGSGNVAKATREKARRHLGE